MTSIQCRDLSSLICATLDFEVTKYLEILVVILQQLQHVKELTFGREFIKTLAELEYNGFEVQPLLKSKSLTLDIPDFARHPSGVGLAVGILPELEKLVIKDSADEAADISTKYSDSKGSALNSIVSCLKTVHIVGLGKSKDH